MTTPSLPPLSPTHFRALLKPLVRLFLRSSQSFQAFQALAKDLFVEVSSEELSEVTHKINVSRISAQTGINRQEVGRLLEAQQEAPPPPISFIQKLVGLWERDAQFTTKGKKPRVLSYEGVGSEFETLVYQVSQHLNVGTVLFTLVSKGIAEKTSRGLRLNTSIYFNSGDTEEVMKQLAFDFDTLCRVTEENLRTSPGPCHHLLTQYDNVRPDQLKKIRQWFHSEGRKFHRKARALLSKLDLDITPPKGGKTSGGGKVVLGSYGWTLFPTEQPPTDRPPEA
jgi:hypothetical protein